MLDHDDRARSRMAASPGYREDLLAAAADLGLQPADLDDPVACERIRQRAQERWQADAAATNARYAAWIDTHGMANERLKRSRWPGSTSI